MVTLKTILLITCMYNICIHTCIQQQRQNNKKITKMQTHDLVQFHFLLLKSQVLSSLYHLPQCHLT